MAPHVSATMFLVAYHCYSSSITENHIALVSNEYLLDNKVEGPLSLGTFHLFAINMNGPFSVKFTGPEHRCMQVSASNNYVLYIT